MSAPPLRRNRDFVLLQGGQLLSSAGSGATAIAYPLLVLGLTGSPADAGLVTFARVLPLAVFGPMAGIAADRYDRRRLMIAADGVRAAAVAGLAAAVVAGWCRTVAAHGRRVRRGHRIGLLLWEASGARSPWSWPRSGHWSRACS